MMIRRVIAWVIASASLGAFAAGVAVAGSTPVGARTIYAQETLAPTQAPPLTPQLTPMQTPAATATRPRPSVAYATPPPVEAFPSTRSGQAAPDGIRDAISSADLGPRPVVCGAPEASPRVSASPPLFPYDGPAWNKPLELISCGWKPGEPVTVSVVLPGGRSVVLGSGQSDARGAAVYVFNGSRTDPFGTYRFVFAGGKDRAEFQVQLAQPAGARLFLESDGMLYLFGFRPDELVRLFEYCAPSSRPQNERMPLTAWQIFSVDGRGQLLVKLNRIVVEDRGILAASADRQGQRRCHYIVVGSQSSEVHVAGEWTGASFKPISAIGVQAVRADTGNDRLRVRTEPSNAAPDVTRVPAETELPVVSAFVQEDGLWWHVRLPDGEMGWVIDRFVARLRGRGGG